MLDFWEPWLFLKVFIYVLNIIGKIKIHNYYLFLIIIATSQPFLVSAAVTALVCGNWAGAFLFDSRTFHTYHVLAIQIFPVVFVCACVITDPQHRMGAVDYETLIIIFISLIVSVQHFLKKFNENLQNMYLITSQLIYPFYNDNKESKK